MKLLVRFAAAGCRNQPGEKSEYKIAGKPMPSRRKGEIPCQRHRNKSKKKKDPTLNAQLLSARPEVAKARRAKATGEDPKGPNSLSPSLRLPILMPPESMWDLEFIMWQCPKAGLRCRFA